VARGVEHIADRSARVGALGVRRALPTRGHRTVGAWCFADHMGPELLAEGVDVGIAPHPHIGLQTVTWLFDGELVHRDSLGTEQSIRPGQLNLMTAGHGVSHAEESPGRRAGALHGVQLWVAQPSGTRAGAAAFEHHGALPVLERRYGTATVLIGTLEGTESPASHDTDHLGVELRITRGPDTIGVAATHEHAVVVVEGAVTVEGSVVVPGELAYVAAGRDELAVSADAPSTALLLGGTPFDESLVMWWNFVARTREEITQAHRDWVAHDERFGTVASSLARIEIAPPAWATT